MVWPTTISSVATLAAAWAKRGFSSVLAVAQLDHARGDDDPAAALGRQAFEQVEGGRRPGRVGVVGVVDDGRPRCVPVVTCRRWAAVGSDGRRLAIWSAVTPSSRATATAHGQVGRRGRPARVTRAISRLPVPPGTGTKTRRLVAVVHDAHRSPSGRRPSTAGPRLPDGLGPVGERGQAGVVDVEDGDLGPLEDLGLGLGDAVLAAHALEVDRSDGGDHGDVRRAPRAHARRSRPARRCPSRPRTRRCPGRGAR